MTVRPLWRAAVLALLVAGCATTPIPPPEEQAPQPEATPPPPEPTPMIESPPIEPVEPPLPAPSAPAPQPEAPPPSVTITPPAPAPSVVPPSVSPPAPPSPAPAPAPAEPAEDAQVVALLGELSRYAALSADDLRREVAAATAALARQRTDVNRLRLAVLYMVARAPQDDQRALQLLDNVARSGGPTTPVKNLATVLQVQLVERQRAVREEQQKSEQAVRKLDQLLEMERALLRDRVRSGGGGGGGGGGGSAGH